MVFVGVVVGPGVAAAGTRVLASVLYGVGSTDAGIFAAMAAILLRGRGIRELHSRRASRIHPVTALRYE